MGQNCTNCGRPEVWNARAGRPIRPSHPAGKSNRFPACDRYVAPPSAPAAKAVQQRPKFLARSFPVGRLQ